ncbi:hypothetical protein T03_8278, partial [Trichinella britovi]
LAFAPNKYKLKPNDSVMWTDLQMTDMIHQSDHIKHFPVDQHLAYKMEKNELKKRCAKKLHPYPQFAIK